MINSLTLCNYQISSISIEYHFNTNSICFRFVVLRRVFFIGGIHYYYRAITMYVTVLPKPDTRYPCAPQSNETTVSGRKIVICIKYHNS